MGEKYLQENNKWWVSAYNYAAEVQAELHRPPRVTIYDKDDAIAEILRRVKENGIEKRGLVDPAEFKEIVESVMVA
jgi:hypothetical protein